MLVSVCISELKHLFCMQKVIGSISKEGQDKIPACNSAELTILRQVDQGSNLIWQLLRFPSMLLCASNLPASHSAVLNSSENIQPGSRFTLVIIGIG